MLHDQGLESDDPHPTAWYGKAKALRGFLGSNDFSIMDQPSDSPLAQTVNAWMGKYATIHLDEDELDLFRECVEKNIKDPKPITIEEPKFFVFNLNRAIYEKVRIFQSKKYEDKVEQDADKSVLMQLTGLKASDLTLEKYIKKTMSDNKKAVFSKSDVPYDIKKNKANDKNNNLTKDFVKFVEDLKFDDLNQNENQDNYLSLKKTYIRYHHYNPTANTWRDAKLVYWLGLEFGLRKKEMMTLSSFPTKLQEEFFTSSSSDDVTFAKADHGTSSGLMWNTVTDQMSVQAITWKTRGMGDQGTVTVNPCLHKDSNDLFRKRQNELMKKYPTQLENDEPINFLGSKDEYLSSDLLYNETAHPTAAQQLKMELLQGCLKHCYASVGKKWKGTQKYFFTHPLHSWRHIFAQYWLYKTDYDYEWVATRGHWTGIEILRKSYGKVLARVTAIKDILAAEVANMKGQTIASRFDTNEDKIKAVELADSLKEYNRIINLLRDKKEWDDKPIEQYYRAKSQVFNEYSAHVSPAVKTNKFLLKQMRKFEASEELVNSYNNTYNDLKEYPFFIPAEYVENQELIDKELSKDENN